MVGRPAVAVRDLVALYHIGRETCFLEVGVREHDDPAAPSDASRAGERPNMGSEFAVGACGAYLFLGGDLPDGQGALSVRMVVLWRGWQALTGRCRGLRGRGRLGHRRGHDQGERGGSKVTAVFTIFPPSVCCAEEA